MNIGQIIKDAGLKATPQRKMIYELMTELGHSPIDEIIVRVQQQNPETTLSTVYRILDSFCKAGLLSKMNHPSGKCYYDITPTDHHHVFMDGETIDYVDPELTSLIKNHLREKSFEYSDFIDKIAIQVIVNNKRCQSCGLPFNEEHKQYIAKEKDGSDSIYCTYCSKDGAFLDPNATASDMIELGVPFLAEKIGEKAAREHLEALIPTLDRWKNQK